MNVKSKVTKSSIQIIFLTLIIKLASFVKQATLASHFGTSIDLDLFLLSSDTLGDFSNAVFSALSVSVMTLYVKYVTVNEREKANKVVDQACKIFIPISLSLAICFYLGADNIAPILANYYTAEQQLIVAHYIKIVSPTITILCISYLNVAILDGNQEFWPGKMINFTLSVVLILATTYYGDKYGTEILPYAYTLAYLMQMVLVFCRGSRYYTFKFHRSSSEKFIRPLLIMFWPMLMGNAAVEINALIDKYIATSLGGGALSAQIYGSTLNVFVTAIFITAPATVFVSYFTMHVAKKEKEELSELSIKIIQVMLLLILPISLVSIINYKNIVQIVYMRGEFNPESLAKTASVLLGYSFGFAFTSVREVLIKVHLAYRDSKTVMINGLISMGANIICSILLVHYFGIVGISLGTSVSAFVGVVLVIKSVKRYMYISNLKSLVFEMLKMIISIVVAGLATFLVIEGLDIQSVYVYFLLSTCIVFFSYIIFLFVINSKALYNTKDIITTMLKGGK